jgi:tight adherence protein B
MNLDLTTLIVILVAATIGVSFYALYMLLMRRKTALADRLETYAAIEEEAALATDVEMQKLGAVPRLIHSILGRGVMQRLEENLARADLPIKPTEFVLLRLVLAGVGFVLGYYGLKYLHSGVLLAVLGYVVPGVVVLVYQNKRRAKFVRQLADALMLLTNSLRSGYGFLKGLELVAKEMEDPISKELTRMLREVNLGATIEQAMMNLGKRIDSQDLDIVISAYLVQKDVGGNLTEIMEKVAETIRERLKIQGDIRVLTAQGRLSGLIVGLLPLVLFLIFLVYMPFYFEPLFGPPTMDFGGLKVPVGVLLLLAGLCWQLIGGFLIFKIINIKV